jgi:hypothetical protein
MSTASTVREALHPDTLSCKSNVYTARWGFFYTHGRTAERYVDAVKKAFPEAVILGSGEVWKNFRGGASVAQQSHFYVKFSVVPRG